MKKAMKVLRRITRARLLVPTLIFVGALGMAGIIGFTNIGHTLAAGTMRYDGASEYTAFTCANYNMQTGVYEWWTTPNTCTFTCDAAHNGQSCSVTTNVGSGSYEPCTGFTTCVYSVCRTEEYTCVYTEPICPASNACAATTYNDSTCTDSCGNVYTGTVPRYTQAYYQGSYGPDTQEGCGAEVPTGINCSYGETTFTTCSPTQMGYLRGTATTKSCGGGGYSQTSNWGYCQADAACAYAQGYYQATYSPTYTQGYYQAYYQGYYEGSYYSEGSYGYSEGSYAPSCSSPTATITASPGRVRSGQTATLTLTGTGISGSCTVTGPGVSQTVNASSCGVSGTFTTPAITSQSTYNVTCDSAAATAKVIVNVISKIIEF